jgi:hypothetical protein
MGIVSASDNVTDDVNLVEEPLSQSVDETPVIEEAEDEVVDSSPVEEVESSIADSSPVEEVKSISSESPKVVKDAPKKVTTKIQAKDVTTYYKEKSQFVSYLKDSNNKPISNKKVSISIGNKVYNKVTDNAGKIVLKLNLKPKTYAATIKFAGDDNYIKSIAKATVKVNKASLSITSKNLKTYFESGVYFKAKVINKITKNPVEGIKVAFKVYTGHKSKFYYATTNSKGVASLKKNFKVGSYKVVSSIKKDRNIKSKSSGKSTLTIKPTAGMGCASFYVQISNLESFTAFRRDATNAKDLYIVKCKIGGKSAIKQYKTGSYFFHSVTTSDGWMMATGGIDNPDINRAIEKLGGSMIKLGSLKKSTLNKIQSYEQALGLGHFSIKAPDGRYALIWGSGVYSGKLNPGEYLSVPNGMSYYRHGTWAKFNTNPKKAIVKIAATDGYGLNRRDVTAFHWMAMTKDGKTTSFVDAYAADDNGNLVGLSTGYLRDNIYFKDKFISKYDLPNTPASKYIGTVKFGSIDKLIKKQTTVKAPKLNKKLNQTKTFDITVKHKKTKKAVKNLKLKLKIGKKVFTVKTNAKGVAKFNTKRLGVGVHKVLIYSANIKYYVSTKSKITIKS